MTSFELTRVLREEGLVTRDQINVLSEERAKDLLHRALGLLSEARVCTEVMQNTVGNLGAAARLFDEIRKEVQG